MSELLSVGLDVGTTSTQMVVSRLEIENRAGSFSVPEMEITRREILYKSPIHFTPLISGELVDASALCKLVDEEYRNAGITKQDVGTGAVIITGETSRRENAAAVLEALSEYAGDFVVATAGPDLESVLAAKGSGAVDYSENTGKTVLHMDIGGGTANLALIENGKITGTGCLNVGGRLLKMDEAGRLTYVSPVLAGLFTPQVGENVTRDQVMILARKLAEVLEASAGLRPREGWMDRLRTPGASVMPAPGNAVISFSGGVADCIGAEKPWLAYGDMGGELGQAIRESRLCSGDYILGAETIRATVIGAGSHSARLSGSTVFYRNVDFPLRNLPVICLSGAETPGEIREKIHASDTPPVLALPGEASPEYEQVACLADILAEASPEGVVAALQADMAKALGFQLALRMGEHARILCIDRVKLATGDYLDVGAPLGPALPVVVKTLILNR